MSQTPYLDHYLSIKNAKETLKVGVTMIATDIPFIPHREFVITHLYGNRIEYQYNSTGEIRDRSVHLFITSMKNGTLKLVK